MVIIIVFINYYCYSDVLWACEWHRVISGFLGTVAAVVLRNPNTTAPDYCHTDHTCVRLCYGEMITVGRVLDPHRQGKRDGQDDAQEILEEYREEVRCND